MMHEQNDDQDFFLQLTYFCHRSLLGRLLAEKSVYVLNKIWHRVNSHVTNNTQTIWNQFQKCIIYYIISHRDNFPQPHPFLATYVPNTREYNYYVRARYLGIVVFKPTRRLNIIFIRNFKQGTGISKVRLNVENHE